MVYFVWDSGSNAIKIGVSGDPVGRVADLQVGNPNVLFLLGAADGDEEAESTLHVRFSTLLISGEWFRPSQELMRHIRDVVRPIVEADVERASPDPRPNRGPWPFRGSKSDSASVANGNPAN
jgi:Meiotically up-regulated gene 113